MPHILKNNLLEIHIALPTEGYNFSRFDWTGKLKTVKFKEQEITTHENSAAKNSEALGRGFYNEFGIDNALGFEEAPIGGWFHKIGVGLLKKQDAQYSFAKNYPIKPAAFTVAEKENSLTITCKGALTNGYAYALRKEITLLENGFAIDYYLKNTGNKNINTTEYVHNFIDLTHTFTPENAQLSFPFTLEAGKAGQIVNPSHRVKLKRQTTVLNSTPNEPFFFSYLNGNKTVKAHWQLVNTHTNIGLTETGNFACAKVNLWGHQHVISPELFIDIHLKPNEEKRWTRNYRIFEI